MRTLFILTTLLFSATAFSSPQTATLEGSMTFMSDMKAIPVTLELVLKKEKSEKTTYKGKLSYMDKGKMRSRTMFVEIDREDAETTASTSYEFGRLEFETGVISLETGKEVSFHMTYLESRRPDCSRHGRTEICIPQPDRVVDSGTLDLTVTSTQ